MKTLTIGYTRFAVPSNWTTKQVGEFAAQLAELSRIDDTTQKIGENYERAYYMVADKGVTIGMFTENTVMWPTYDAARRHLEALAEMQAEAETA
jgi:hypothetical protein